MADPVVHLTNGVPDSGTGNITTLGAVVAALPAALGAHGGLVIEGVASGTPVLVNQAGVWQTRALGNAGAVMDFPGQNSATAANALQVGGQFNTTPTTITSGNSSPLQLDSAGNLLTNIKTAIPAGTAIIGKVGIDQTTDGTTNKVAADLRVAGSAVATGSGVNGSTVIRTALATDSPGIIATGTAGSASAAVLTVQGVAAMTPLATGGVTVTQSASSTITRPADTTAYASGDLVANNTTAGSVTNLQFTTLARVSGGSGVIIGAQIQKSGPTVTNAAFRLHLFNTAPTYTSAGDNSALSTVVVASAKGYLGYIDITAMVGFSDVAWGSGAPDNTRGGIPYVATAQIIYGLLEARGAYTPISGEVFTIVVDALQD